MYVFFSFYIEKIHSLKRQSAGKTLLFLGKAPYMTMPNLARYFLYV